MTQAKLYNIGVVDILEYIKQGFERINRYERIYLYYEVMPESNELTHTFRSTTEPNISEACGIDCPKFKTKIFIVYLRKA